MKIISLIILIAVTFTQVFTVSASAEVLFSTLSGRDSGGAISDNVGSNPQLIADDFSIAAPAIVHSVSWRGLYDPAHTPIFPHDFELTFYSDNAGLPGSVLSATRVTAPGSVAIVDTGDTHSGGVIYSYTAAVTPYTFEAGATYWFSPTAETVQDTDDLWAWTSSLSSGTSAAVWHLSRGSWRHTNHRAYSFSVSGTVIPEPATIGVLGLVLAIATISRQSKPKHPRC